MEVGFLTDYVICVPAMFKLTPHRAQDQALALSTHSCTSHGALGSICTIDRQHQGRSELCDFYNCRMLGLDGCGIWDESDGLVMDCVRLVLELHTAC